MAGQTCGIYEALWLARLHRASAGELYIHIPFCARKCAYCDFSSWATCADDPLIEAYLSAVALEARQAADLGLLEGCTTAYVGGGTPSLAGSSLANFIGQIRDAATKVGELTCEANPESLTDDLLHLLPAAGCTRLSLGVQSLNDRELGGLGRIHSSARALDRLAAACASGLSVSCDLMCAIPDQTEETWTATLARAIGTGVGHVSVYPLQIEEGTPLGMRYRDADAPFNDPDIQAARMETARKLLTDAGFARYEVASYAQEGASCAHNVGYWTAVPYLGLGTSASSMLTREAYDRLRQSATQLPLAPEGIQRVRMTCTDLPKEVAEAPGLARRTYDLEFLDEGQAAAEDLMLAMRMVAGAGPGLLAHARAVLGGDSVDEALSWCQERGLASLKGGSLVPTDRGWLLGNELYGRLWDLAPGQVAIATTGG